MDEEQMERAIATTYANTLALETIVECLLMTHHAPRELLALLEKRIAETRAIAAIELLKVGDRDEQQLSEALNCTWERWLRQARHLLRQP